MARDYYEVLGVSKTATSDELKKAYRKLAMQYHPDRNAGDKKAEQKFKEINEAYDVLKDSQKRAAYDHYGPEGVSGMGSQGGYGGGFNTDGFEFNFSNSGSFSDIFEDLFSMAGGSRSNRRSYSATRGSDLKYNATITLEEAFSGKDLEISLRKQDTCEKCNGTGSANGAKPETCPMCNGSGTVRMSQGFFTVERTCSSCGGQGIHISSPCSKCSGSGRAMRSKKILVHIPAGIDDGVRINVAGEGEAGILGGEHGSLYIYVNVAKHNFFNRDGSNLYCEAPISFVQAALGGEIQIPTIENDKILVKIPEGTQSGQMLKVKGKGMKTMKSSLRGDMFVTVQVETPVNLTDKQKELLREFASLDTKSSHPKNNSFWSKFRFFF